MKTTLTPKVRRTIYFVRWTRSTETSDGLAAIQAQLNNLGREIKKVNVKVYGAQVGCELCKGPHYTKDCPLKEEGKTIEEAYYTQFGLPFQQGGQYRVAATRFYQRNNGNPSRLYDDCCDEEEGSYELKDLDAYSIGTTLLADALPTKEKDTESFTLPCLINNLCFNKALADLGASVSVMDFLTYARLGLVDYNVLDMPEDINTPLILGRPFLSTVHAKIDVFKRKLTLRVGNDKIEFKSDKPISNIIKRIIILGPLYEDYIELNDLNEPLKLRRNQVDDLEPTIVQDEVVDEPMLDIFLCMIDYEHINASFFPFLSINVMSKSFYNSIVKDKVEYKGRNVVGDFMNVPIFVGNFSVVTDFVVVENMDSYRDEGIGDIIVGIPFCKDACIKARRFDGMITIYKENDSLTYEMASSHPRFKHLTNAQCNKMRPMLKVSAQDELKGSGYHQKDRKPSQNDKTEHGMEKTVQNQGQSPKMPKSESIQMNQQSNRSRN
ncbi:hypothetical protein Tco_0753087 [Tanacetum coccineum]